MIIFVALLLTVLAFAFVAYPLLRRRSSLVDVGEDGELRELHSKRDTTYSMLKELEFDLQSDILSRKDYQELEARYKRKAISILRDMDDLEKGSDVEQEIEKQVQKLRLGMGKSSPLDEEVEKEILKLRRSQGSFCPKCGARSRQGDRFCSRCGARLRQGG